MKQNILVVDDELEVLDLLSIFLGRRGYDVAQATTIAAAENALSHDSFCLIILDVLLPDGLGLDFLDYARVRHPEIPIILLTGIGYDEELFREATAKGAAGYVSKLLPLDQLLMEIHRALKAVKSRPSE